MGGRSVGGAVGAGCGAFSLVGLLAGVGLTLWLGAQALDGTSGSPDRDRSVTTTVPELAGALDAIEELTGPGGLPTAGGPALVVAPATGLTDGAAVAIAGSSLPVGPVELIECLTYPVPGVSPCDATTTVTAVVGEDRGVVTSGSVRRILQVGGTAYDCAAFVGACSLTAQVADSGVVVAAAPLGFAAGLDPSAAARPPTS